MRFGYFLYSFFGIHFIPDHSHFFHFTSVVFRLPQHVNQPKRSINKFIKTNRMKKYMMYFVLAFMLVSNVVRAQRFEKGEVALEVRGGLANGYFFGKQQNPTFFGGVAANIYTGIDSKWVAGGEFYHKKYDYQDGSIKLAQFTGEIGHYFPLVYDCKQDLVISAGVSGIAGYERINWGRHTLYDQAILLNQDHFIFGGAATLEVEFFPSDRLILFVNGKERMLFKAVDKFNGQIGIGARILIN